MWIDVAKGLSIVLVVLVHVTNRHLLRLDDVGDAIRAWWDLLGRRLRPVRMPLFFLLSALLAAPALRRRDPVQLRRRVVRSLELYVVWLLLHVLLVDRRFRPDAAATSLGGFLEALVLPSGSLWYLWALGTYLGALALVPRRLRPAAVVGTGALWFVVAARLWHLDPRPRDLVQYLGWFTLGAFLPAIAPAVVHRATDRRAALAVAAFAAATLWLRPLGPQTIPVLQVLGVTAGLGVAARLRGPVANRLGGLGRRTLAVYVLHAPLLTLWNVLVRRLGWEGALPHPLLQWLYPLALGGALVAGSLTIERGLRHAGLGRLFGDRRSAPLPDRDVRGAVAGERRAVVAHVAGRVAEDHGVVAGHEAAEVGHHALDEEVAAVLGPQDLDHRLGEVDARHPHAAGGEGEGDPAGADGELEGGAVAGQVGEQVHGRPEHLRFVHGGGRGVVAGGDLRTEVVV